MQLIPVNRSHAELIERLMRERNHYLIDTRRKPLTGFPGWSKPALAKYGDSYVWLGDKLGNKNYDHPELGIEIVDLEGGLIDLMPLLQDRPVLLLCGCGTLDPTKERPHGCHNRTVCNAAVEWCSQIEIVMPERLIAREQMLTALQDERIALEQRRPTLKNYWGLSASDQQMLRREGGLKK